jgi:DNA repair exonuclease SbcCD ATPase subunit
MTAGVGSEGAVSTARDITEDIPRIRLQGPAVEPVTPTAPVMVREHSGSLSHGKRQTFNRRISPGNTTLDHGNTLPGNFVPADVPTDVTEIEGTVDELNRHLEGLQKEADDIYIQIRKEDEDFLAARDDLSYQNDHLKQSIHDKETGSAELRKEWQKLDRKCKAVQKEKREVDQELQRKQVEREKMQQDIKRWDKDIADNKKKSKRTEKERKKVTDDIEKRISEAKNQIAEDQKAIVVLEEEVKSKGIQIRDLEGARKRLGSSSEDGDSGDHDKIEREKDVQWTVRQGELRRRYASMAAAHEQASLKISRPRQLFADFTFARPIQVLSKPELI